MFLVAGRAARLDAALSHLPLPSSIPCLALERSEGEVEGDMVRSRLGLKARGYGKRSRLKPAGNNDAGISPVHGASSVCSPVL